MVLFVIMMQMTNKRTSEIQASNRLEGTVLENVECIKYLGVTITKDLKWNCAPKANRIAYISEPLFCIKMLKSSYKH